MTEVGWLEAARQWLGRGGRVDRAEVMFNSSMTGGVGVGVGCRCSELSRCCVVLVAKNTCESLRIPSLIRHDPP